MAFSSSARNFETSSPAVIRPVRSKTVIPSRSFCVISRLIDRSAAFSLVFGTAGINSCRGKAAGPHGPERRSVFGKQTRLAAVKPGDFLPDRLKRGETSHERDHFLMGLVDFHEGGAFRAAAFDGAAAIDVRIERRMPRAPATPS